MIRQEINLYRYLPEEKSDYGLHKKSLLFYGIFIVVLILLDILADFQKNSAETKYNNLKNIVTTQQKQLDELTQQYPIANLEELEKHLKDLRAMHEQKLFLYNSLLLNVDFSRYLLGLAKSSIDGVWLTEIHISRNIDKVLLKGLALKHAMLEQYHSQLTKEPVFANIMFELNEVSGDVSPEAFSITAKKRSIL